MHRRLAIVRRRLEAFVPDYGTDGQGNPYTGDCTTTVAPGDNLATAITNATAGDVLCVQASDRSTATVTINKAITVRAIGQVLIKNAVISGGATLDGFTIVGGAAGNPQYGVEFSGNNNVIQNNLINGHGIERGIFCSSCGTGTVIDHNTLTELNNYGIFITNGTDIVVSYNNIYNFWDDTGNGLDVDGMRVWGNYHIVKNNYIHDMNRNLSILGPDNDLPHLDGFQNYQASGGTSIANHITYENNYVVRVSGNFLITENNLHPAYDLHDYIIRGNVAETYGTQNLILKGIDGAIVENNFFIGGNGTSGCITCINGPGGGASQNIQLRNNIMVQGNADDPYISNGSGGAPVGVIDNTNNVGWIDTAYNTAAADHLNNPQHVTTPIIASDFTSYPERALANGSLTDTGSPLLSTGYTMDIHGRTRVQGDAVDSGPYEFG